jgi:transcriptional regulator with XRE-family HTH domain
MMSDMTPVGELIEETRRLNDWSYRDLERRSGDVVSKARFQQLARGQLRAMPEARTINGIAKALALPVSVVVDRLLATLGIPRPGGGPQPPELAIAADEHLDEAAKEALLAQLRLLRERYGWDPSNWTHRTAV